MPDREAFIPEDKCKGEIAVLGSVSKLERIRICYEETRRVTLPDGSAIFAPLVHRPRMRNAMTTPEDILAELVRLLERGPVTITELGIGEPAIAAPRIVFARRQTVSARPCDGAE